MKSTRIVLVFKPKISRMYFEDLIAEIAKRFGYSELGTEAMGAYYDQVKYNSTRPAICICPVTKQVGPVLPNIMAKAVREGHSIYKVYFIEVVNK